MVESKTHVKKSRLIHLGYGTTFDFFDQQIGISEYLIKRLIRYALNRIDGDLRELVQSKAYKISIWLEKLDEKEPIKDGSFQVNFTSANGLMISVDTIYIDSNYRPFLDHGVSIAEGQ
jgi:hypothetical protein